MQAGFKSFLILILLAVILLVSLKILATPTQVGALKVVDHAITTAYRYIASALVYPIDAAKNLCTQITEMWRAAEKTKKLDELEAENRRLKIDLRELRRENASLSELLNLSQNLEQKTIVARIVGKITSPRNMLVIDKGKNDGITKGQAVICANGLVGYISEAGLGWSRVALITDPLTAVDAFAQRSLERGIVRGYKDGLLLMEYLPKTADIKKQDLILTSGKGFIFPGGIELGYVLSVIIDQRTSGIKAIIKPSSPINKLNKVLIITQEQKQ